jgi:hypothetical protein
MYYLTDHITSVNGVQALLPTKHVEELGRYKVLVVEKDFQSVRNHMKKYLLPWYEQYVEPDALNPEYKFSGPPTVAQIDADDYSDDEDSYMTVSVNTAMSMASVLSDDTTVDPVIPSAVGITSPNWADVASEVTQTPPANVDTSPQGSNQTEADLTSALSSSQAEVHKLRDQVAELKAEREKTAQVIAEAVKQQVAEALAAQLPQQARDDHVTSQQFATFIQVQERKFDVLTTMFAQMLSTKPAQESPAPSPEAANLRYYDDSARPAQTLGKRSAQEEIDPREGCTDPMETGEFETTSKRLDSRHTPERGAMPRASDIDPDIPDLVPRRLLSDSPTTVPLPDSPPDPSHLQVPSKPASETPENNPAMQTETRKAHPVNFQQQSMSRYLRVDPTGTIIQQDDPPETCPAPESESSDESSASLSAAEDASSPPSSGTESKQPAQTSSQERHGSPVQQS